MVRLRIALGVASSLVAVAALSIVFTGTGQAQGNGNGPNPQNVNIVNTPLPVIGNVTATLSGNVSANIINPANNPVLVRDVDAQGVKELWQAHINIEIPDGIHFGQIVFDPVPAGKALVLEHINFLYSPLSLANTQGVFTIGMNNTSSFGGSAPEIQYFLPQQMDSFFMADLETKFYVGPGMNLRLPMQRKDPNGPALALATATGYLVDYP